jgi:glycosyltransferase involved in cell wall biosynthesis
LKVFISYQYFLPAYKAGGPIQSLDNLVKSFTTPSYFIYCSNKDIDGRVLSEVENDKWIDYLPNAKVFYCSDNGKRLYQQMDNIKPDIVFSNGLFSYPFSIRPVMWKGKCRKILSVRGMLHPGALSQKAFKKTFFLSAFKWLGLNKKCEFHATTTEESDYTKAAFGKDAKVWVARNYPKELLPAKALHKQSGELSLVTVALISPMKNIKLILEALQKCTSKIVYSIYGPVKDAEYWNQCQSLLNTMPANVTVKYCGAMEPESVEAVLTNSHCFIMPSKSENYGHAIIEALSIGRPVITSTFTPWNKLEQAKAGYNIDNNEIITITKAIESIAVMNNDEYELWSTCAAVYAKSKVNVEAIASEYKAMFEYMPQGN